jgi:hypothetical protein
MRGAPDQDEFFWNFKDLRWLVYVTDTGRFKSCLRPNNASSNQRDLRGLF